MAIEIERKFLVKDSGYMAVADSAVNIRQAYLSTDPRATVCLRIAGDRAFITVKSLNHGAARGEWEYEIPSTDAMEMMERCAVSPVIVKTRYRCGRWEIDRFGGSFNGLTVAEIELTDENEKIDLPAWIGREVTGDARYYNSSLSLTGQIPQE